MSKTSSVEDFTMSSPGGLVTEEHLLAMSLGDFKTLLETWGMNYQSFDDSLLVRTN